jgi:hypothetical protein
MTKFERDTLMTLLCMFQKEVKEKDEINLMGNKVTGEKKEEYQETLNNLVALVSMTK